MHKFDDIIPPSRRKEIDPVSQPAMGPVSTPIRAPHRGPRFPFMTIAIVVLIIAGSVGSLIYFSSAKIEIVPKDVSAAVQSSFTATEAAGELPFKVITAQKVATQSLKGTGTKDVTSSASGMITLYNTQNKPQTLVIKTRFATNAGLVYRIQAPVTIPAGSDATPGTVTARVVADQSGSSYNVGPSSFTVPGFSGTPQATQVYARSTTAMNGGASGSVPTVDTIEEVQARAALTTALGPDLAKSLEVPAGYVLLPGSATTSYQQLDSAPSETAGQVELKQQGTITAVVFPNAALAKAIAGSVAGLNYQGEPVTLSATDTLNLEATSGIPDAGATSFAFTLSGTAPLTYTVDTARIAAAVAGKTRSAAEVALTNYPEVSRAVIVLRPFWKQTFPEDPASIDVTVASPQP